MLYRFYELVMQRPALKALVHLVQILNHQS